MKVHVPSGYDPKRPAPLLILLHGYGSSGLDHDAYFDLGTLVEERGFLYAYPDGTFDTDGNRFWNATDACCDLHRTGVDDAAYLSGVITEIGKSLSVDPKRIDLIGHSNGGFMAHRMACGHADQVAAIISLAGATFAKPADCAPAAPVAVVEIHGTDDDTVLFEGGTLNDLSPGAAMAAYPGAEATVESWATSDGCAKASVVAERLDLDAGVVIDGSPAESTVKRWAGCRPGGAVELWTIPNGGHGPDLSDAFPTTVLDFFEAHPKP